MGQASARGEEDNRGRRDLRTNWSARTCLNLHSRMSLLVFLPPLCFLLVTVLFVGPSSSRTFRLTLNIIFLIHLCFAVLFAPQHMRTHQGGRSWSPREQEGEGGAEKRGEGSGGKEGGEERRERGGRERAEGRERRQQDRANTHGEHRSAQRRHDPRPRKGPRRPPPPAAHTTRWAPGEDEGGPRDHTLTRKKEKLSLTRFIQIVHNILISSTFSYLSHCNVRPPKK